MTDEELTELYEERAAIIEYEGKRPRIIAEAMARADIEDMKRKEKEASEQQSFIQPHRRTEPRTAGGT
tara:strand:- start:2582 stop:2785 length:204 start_codon:yes stop_codon:yes gene_type:complete